MTPGAWTNQARQRPASITPGATMAPVGQAGSQARHVPQASATGSGAGGKGAVVSTDPSTNQDP